jgi:hypothetical protein
VQGTFHKQALKLEEGSLSKLNCIDVGDRMETWIDERFAPFLMRILFVFEPLTPRFVSFSLKRRLREWKDKRLIDD